MQISQMLKTLEGKGFVLRQRSASDSRAKRVEVTQAGTDVLRKALPTVIEVQKRLFGEGGEPGGDFLKALLRLDSDQVKAETD